MYRRKASDEVHVVYSEETWRVFRELREKARVALRCLDVLRIPVYVVGSVARGDVTRKSDVDLFLERCVAPSYVTGLLEECGFLVEKYEVIWASPQTAVKLVIHVEDNVKVTLPVTDLSPAEKEFPRFAGSVTSEDVDAGRRVAGVNKFLRFIEPTEDGHVEWSILGREEEVARRLGISLGTVLEREAMRMKRWARGKSGFLVHECLDPRLSPEDLLRRLATRNQLLRKKLEGVMF
ncbi:nucleotidyltransferase domain-containing protein [Thermofilum pendens]|uniref:Nucleotidyltransferase of the DNA polymerase beta superfamily n=1 Tax=Thermofilum pendens (strain DSM 2475 / Hrk 5) TaxID=368408 RepID=A1RXX3_THEPD|nr:nucleotidyltransferase domain-containing protein [Thermofilum pendens]ABL78053.1 nucleotidyltransferase of the DNA polymerase beta superfamily [Thermofilum pendens Hrk 5]